MPLFGFFMVAIASYGTVAGIRRWAYQRGLLDRPNQRSSHTQPTPRGGGAAVVIFTVAAAVWWLFTHGRDPVLLAYVVGGVIVAAISAIDDLRGLSSGIRLLVQGLSAAAVLAALWWTHRGSWTAPEVVAFGMAFVWIVGLTNAYNFMDGIDGIAGIQAVTAGLSWAAIGALHHDGLTLAVGGVIAAAALGFLLHNWAPASIFMGDVGSAFLGFSFAVIPLWERYPAIAAACVVWPFLFDAAFTLVRRLMRRENIFAAHRSHLYQRLVISGMRHDRVSIIYGAVAAAGGAVAIAVAARMAGAASVAVAYMVVSAAGMWLFTLGRERRARRTAAA